ncbi:ATPase family AAA domain-containing protein 1-A [Escovopsis weberi]|uniref:ATPase family AAA domain-containing protein 1-A n=1 Tax=Escovopsis weberi TaxID=150374 RepID=A0A0M9VTA6_ESCWE|nr:ATPase family AAA domain-containing protein 1-A [Escovopsis weberi]
MHAPAVRSLPTVALAARAPRCLHRRALHSSPRRLNTNGSGANGAKPVDETSSIEHHEDTEIQSGPETSGGRLRGYATASARNRHARKKPVSALPPIQLPKSFLDNNITLYVWDEQPQLPPALAEDAKHSKPSRLPPAQTHASPQVYKALETYFETALSDLLLKDCELAMDFMKSRLENDPIMWNTAHQIAKVVRVWDMIIDSAWHLTDAICQRPAEYTYKTRPYWWWHLHKDLDYKTLKFRDQPLSLAVSLDDQITFAEHFDHPLPHGIADLPLDTFAALQKSVERELKVTPPPTFDFKSSKRPINILSLSGYSGKSVSEATAEYIAYWSGADLIKLDAYDISELVGDYLGQNWAHSRGPLSMLGFRAAELNGKLETGQDAAAKSAEEDEELENVINVRSTSGTLEEELQKIKQGGFECFTKWENLKIDKIFDHVIRAVNAKATQPRNKPVLIHVHDLIELNMTLEGSLLINRLRSLVDAAWQQGMKVAIFGTSACAQPSEEYLTAIQDLSATDFVITRHIEPDRAADLAIAKLNKGRPPFHLQKTDFYVENISNINRMLRALDPEASGRGLDLASDAVRVYLNSPNPRFSVLRESILPAPEVYHLAMAYRSLEKQAGCGPAGFVERFVLGPLRQRPGQNFLDEERPDAAAEAGEAAKTGDEAHKADGRAALKLNEYEKRISSGQINKDNLRVTFGDVHVPPETISALKLLTSLALVRPDAFSYGVLAADKIPGCLLYGPPGTGKTMLAKAVAKESGANILEISGASINDKWVGESEKLIRAVFTLAKKLSPCVVFIDEADSLLANRSMFSNRASHREHINQFLKEWDGMEETNAFIMVATNRPFDLDDAVLRRLPRKILVDLPLQKDRLAILNLLLRGETLDPAVSLEELSHRTPYYSGSDLKNVCVAAAMAAVEEENEAAARHTGAEPFRYPERRVLTREHFEKALKQIPASISEDMVSLKMVRKFDEEYGNRRKGGKKSGMGFGIVGDDKRVDAGEAWIRPPPPAA